MATGKFCRFPVGSGPSAGALSQAGGWACGAGRFSIADQSPPGLGRSSRRQDHSAFCILHSAFCLEGALQVQGFGGKGAGGRAGKLKLGKQSTLRSTATEDGKTEIARRRAPRSATVSCPPHLPVPRALVS
jgi:hypothetical protein